VHGLSTVDSALTTRVAALEGSVEIDLVPIPPGSFTMGSPVTERDRNTNETLHGVILTKSISMGATEVTQAQFRAVMGWNPSAFAGCSDCPVENVNWYDAREFCLRLTDRHRAEGTIAKSAFYRLPTESEWEYACRAGTGTRFFFGDALECGNSQSDFCALANQYMWWSGNQSATAYGPQPVAGKQANPWGLYDMNGNVWEMCSDQFGDYPQGEVTDPQGSAPSLPGIRDRAFRGGSWSATLNGCRSAMRFGYDALDRHGLGGSGTVGFRVVLEVPQ
jgi:formylglycine-generating enzyme required for sulfatase activity